MEISSRLRYSIKAAGLHFSSSLIVSLFCAFFVFVLWYPYPYYEMAGGRELFLIVVGVDVICGPLITLVIFNPSKSRRELFLDLGLVILLQVCALSYGLNATWQARPIYLVMEVDRFKIINASMVDRSIVEKLPASLMPLTWGGVRVVGLRAIDSPEERSRILISALEGGRDYAEFPEYYIPYEGAVALDALKKAKPLSVFVAKYPKEKAQAEEISQKNHKSLKDLQYLPVSGRQDWVALLDENASVLGFLRGDGFSIR